MAGPLAVVVAAAGAAAGSPLLFLKTKLALADLYLMREICNPFANSLF